MLEKRTFWLRWSDRGDVKHSHGEGGRRREVRRCVPASQRTHWRQRRRSGDPKSDPRQKGAGQALATAPIQSTTILHAECRNTEALTQTVALWGVNPMLDGAAIDEVLKEALLGTLDVRAGEPRLE